MRFELGTRARDIVTGFEGVVTAKVEYLTGCIQYAIKPPELDKDGKMRDAHYFDEDSLVAVDAKRVVINVETDGGPQRDCPPR